MKKMLIKFRQLFFGGHILKVSPIIRNILANINVRFFCLSVQNEFTGTECARPLLSNTVFLYSPEDKDYLFLVIHA